MSTKSLVLPFITHMPAENDSISNQAELACVVYIAESQRKKAGLLRDAEKTAFIAKVYYPLWIMPIGNAILILDGLSNKTYHFTFQEPTKTSELIEEIKKNAVDPQRFLETLQIQVKAIREFTTPTSYTFAGLMDDKELLDYLPEYFRSGTIQNYQENVSIPLEIDGPTALETMQTYRNCHRIIQAHIKGLEYAIAQLKEEMEIQTNGSSNEIERLKEKLEQEIAIVKPKVDKAVKRLTQKQDKALASLQKSVDKKIATIEKRREKLMQRLQTAEHKKDSLQKKVDSAKKKKKGSKSDSGTFALKKYEKDVENTKKEIQVISNQLNDARREGEHKLKKKGEEYRTAIAQEENKIVQLSDNYAIRFKEKEKQTKEIANATSELISGLENRIDDLNRSSSVLKSQVEADWKVNDPEQPLLAQLPVYLIKYVKNEEERYNLFSPTAILEEASVLNGLKKMLSLNSEPRLKTTMRPASKRLYEILNEWVIFKIQADATFKIKLNEVCRNSNLIDLNTYAQTLNEGLDEIEKKGWMTKEEAVIFCKRVMEESV